MHVLLVADTNEQLEKCESYIIPLLNNINDDLSKEHKKNQLITLAEINGAIKDSDLCKNCGE